MKGLLIALAACASTPAPAPIAPPPPAVTPPHKTSAGTTFGVPTGWSVVDKGAMTILTPALDEHSHVALIETTAVIRKLRAMPHSRCIGRPSPPRAERHRAALDPQTKASAARVKPVKRDTSALFAAVYASPDADEPREILADALQEAGDPRGEFIALQLREHRGDPSTELRDRAQELCSQHGKTWLGPLRPITYRAEMRRGFLQRLELAGSWSSKSWPALAQEPMLATVEELAVGQASMKIYAAFLGGAIAKTVRTVWVFDKSIWSVVTATEMPRLQHLVHGSWSRGKPPSDNFKTLIAPWLLAHPQITRLTLTDTKSADAIPKPVAARPTNLTVWCSQTAGAKLWAAWPRLHSLTITPSEATITFTRHGKQEHALVKLDRFVGGDGLKLTLPTTIKRLELTNNERMAKAMEKTYQRRYDVAIVKLPSGTITGVK